MTKTITAYLVVLTLLLIGVYCVTTYTQQYASVRVYLNGNQFEVCKRANIDARTSALICGE